MSGPLPDATFDRGPEPSRAALDTSLLRGTVFRCRPGCALCCYARPAVSRSEARALLRLDPDAPIRETDNGFGLVESRPRGGACHFLSDDRCRAYGARPFPCRTFPLHVHVGARPQATLVFGCPGTTLDALRSVSERDPTNPASEPEGLDKEVGRVAAEMARLPIAAWRRDGRRRETQLARRLERRGAWTDPRELVARLASHPPRPTARDFPAEPPPRLDRDGWDSLPLYFDEASGSVTALASRPDGTWEALALRAAGGGRRLEPPRPPPVRPPPLDAEAERLLDLYVSYVARRDAFLWGLYAELEGAAEPSPLSHRAEAELRALGARVLSRAVVLRPGRESDPRERLGEPDIARGIRASDAESLDRPTLGRML